MRIFVRLRHLPRDHPRRLRPLEEPDDNELDHLDTAWGASVLSRLSCQTKVGEGDITVEIPKYSRNHAREE